MASKSKKRNGTRNRPRGGGARMASGPGYAVRSYEVTSEPITDLPENKLPPDLAAEIDRLYHFTQTNPRDCHH